MDAVRAELMASMCLGMVRLQLALKVSGECSSRLRMLFIALKSSFRSIGDPP